MSKRILRVLLYAIAVVMFVAGGASALLGVESLPGVDEASPIVDSEFRFYAVWYVVTGVVVWRALARLDDSEWVVRLVAGGYLFAGVSRALSWMVAGRPHWTQVTLMILEFVLAAGLTALVSASLRYDEA